MSVDTYDECQTPVETGCHNQGAATEKASSYMTTHLISDNGDN